MRAKKFQYQIQLTHTLFSIKWLRAYLELEQLCHSLDESRRAVVEQISRSEGSAMLELRKQQQHIESCLDQSSALFDASRSKLFVWSSKSVNEFFLPPLQLGYHLLFNSNHYRMHLDRSIQELFSNRLQVWWSQILSTKSIAHDEQKSPQLFDPSSSARLLRPIRILGVLHTFFAELLDEINEFSQPISAIPLSRHSAESCSSHLFSLFDEALVTILPSLRQHLTLDPIPQDLDLEHHPIIRYDLVLLVAVHVANFTPKVCRSGKLFDSLQQCIDQCLNTLQSSAIDARLDLRAIFNQTSSDVTSRSMLAQVEQWLQTR